MDYIPLGLCAFDLIMSAYDTCGPRVHWICRDQAHDPASPHMLWRGRRTSRSSNLTEPCCACPLNPPWFTRCPVETRIIVKGIGDQHWTASLHRSADSHHTVNCRKSNLIGKLHNSHTWNYQHSALSRVPAWWPSGQEQSPTHNKQVMGNQTPAGSNKRL